MDGRFILVHSSRTKFIMVNMLWGSVLEGASHHAFIASKEREGGERQASVLSLSSVCIHYRTLVHAMVVAIVKAILINQSK